MKSIFTRIKMSRQRQGLSQVGLAAKTGLGLATIQNIEAGRANPEWSTLAALFSVLNLKFEITSTTLEDLAGFGCPMMTSGNPQQVPSRERLVRILRSLDLESVSGFAREEGAVSAWLAALRDHYPSVWREASIPVQSWLAKRKAVPLKQRRIALARLAEYL